MSEDNTLAAHLAVPERARLLSLLLDGRHRTARELARGSNIALPCIADHLAALIAGRLLRSRREGPHTYYALASDDVAHALADAGLQARPDAVERRWQQPRNKALRRARSCYGHLAGELGVAQLAMLLDRGLLAETAKGLQPTAAGRGWLRRLGVDAKITQLSGRACLDCSQRREHLGGPLGAALLAHYLHCGWLQAQAGTRALQVTEAGRAVLEPLFER